MSSQTGLVWGIVLFFGVLLLLARAARQWGKSRPEPFTRTVILENCRDEEEAVQALCSLEPSMRVSRAERLVHAMPVVLRTGVDPRVAEGLRNALAMQGIGVRIS